MKGVVTSFKDLIVWQKAHSFVLVIYKITATFPKSEQWGLSSQLRRSAVSITSNIAEGFYRRTSADKSNFYTNALGSLGEAENQLIVARDIGYIEHEESRNLEGLIQEIERMIRGIIKSSMTK